MTPQVTGRVLELTCLEPALPEFPDMLFGNTVDGSSSYFDATKYIKNKSLDINVMDFFKDFDVPIRSLMDSYQITEKKVCIMNHEGHFLIDGNLSYLFICYVEPDFLAYIFDRVQELFSRGFAISDSALVYAAKSRLSEDILKKILEDEYNYRSQNSIEGAGV